MKKIILIIIISSLIFSSSGFFTRPAKAIPVEVAVDPYATGGWVATVVGWALEAGRWIKEDLMMALRDAIVKRIVDLMVDQTVAWIQGGGTPQFVTNWQGFLRNAAQAAVGDVVLQTNAAFLCSPFKLQVKLLLLPVPKFSEGVKCTLDDIVENIDDFYKDFEKGGWIAYNEAWQPQNNYYGTIMLVRDEMLVKAALSKEAAEKEAMAGKGFLSVKRCKGGISAEEMKTNPDEYRNFVKDYKGNYCDPKDLENTTPGDIVGAAAAKAIGAQQDWIVNVKSIVSALVNAVINRLVKEGLSAMISSIQESPEGRDYNISAGPEYQDAISQQYDQEKQGMIKETSKLLNEWQYLLDAKNKSLSYTQQTKGVLEQLKQVQANQTFLPPACEPAVTDQEIQAVKNEIDRLTNETKNLQTKIDEASSTITQINNADFFNIREKSLAQSSYLQFMDKYYTTEQIKQIVTGDDRQAADQETQNKQTDLTNAQNRLTICIQSQTSQP